MTTMLYLLASAKEQILSDKSIIAFVFLSSFNAVSTSVTLSSSAAFATLPFLLAKTNSLTKTHKTKNKKQKTFYKVAFLSTCVPNPCMHGGRCVYRPGNGAFACKCAADYAGAVCETSTGDA